MSEKVNGFLLFISRPYIADINLFDDDEKFKKMRDKKISFMQIN
jgi:hypothetical protein